MGTFRSCQNVEVSYDKVKSGLGLASGTNYTDHGAGVETVCAYADTYELALTKIGEAVQALCDGYKNTYASWPRISNLQCGATGDDVSIDKIDGAEITWDSFKDYFRSFSLKIVSTLRTHYRKEKEVSLGCR